MTIELGGITPRTIGMLLYMFEMQTVLSAELLGIDAFDQPGVEQGKRLTYAMMGRRGYDEMRKEIERMERDRNSSCIIEL